MAPILVIEDLSVRYGAVEALKGVTLYLDEGKSPPSSGPMARGRRPFSMPCAVLFPFRKDASFTGGNPER